MNGWIQLHRKILNWDWYSDINTKVLFIHILLKSNFVSKNWQGITIERGELFTSIKHLSIETGLSEKQVRNSIRKLITTKEIEIQGASNGTMITVCNYDDYQRKEDTEGEQKDIKGANDGRAKGQLLNKDNKDNNENKVKDDFDFLKFWNLYNKKVGDKAKILKKWTNLKQIDRDTILKTLPLFLQNITDKKFQPFPDTYLNNKRWNDELIQQPVSTRSDGFIPQPIYR